LTLKKEIHHDRVMDHACVAPFLSARDPAPVERVEPDGGAPVFLLCEHAGRAVPERLGTLGVSAETLNSHRGWDIGAEAVARGLACRLGATLILQRYSRLVIDANRPPGGTESMPEFVDGVEIVGNRDLTAMGRQARIDAIFTPMDEAIAAAFAARERVAAFSIHSFTPQLGDQIRPWHAGFLSRESQETAERLLASVADAAPGLNLAINQPYQISDETDWFIPVHAEARRLPHALIEMRNDQIGDRAGVERWADLLATAIDSVLGALH